MRRRELLKAAGARRSRPGWRRASSGRSGQDADVSCRSPIWLCSTRSSPSTGQPATTPISCSIRSTVSTRTGQAQPQMVEGHEVEADGLTWTLHLRDGLRFHDSEPVLARDVVASIRRFAPRISFASALMAATDELSAPDDRTVKFRLKRPFPHLPMALAGPGGTVPAIMPERLAATSPYQPVKEVVGSGPYRFLKTSMSAAPAPPSRASTEYRPRDGGAPGFTSGPKVAHFDRVEWVTLDPFSAQAALEPRRDRLVGDRRPRPVRPGRARPQRHRWCRITCRRWASCASTSSIRRSTNPAARRALLGAVDQAEAMTVGGRRRPGQLARRHRAVRAPGRRSPTMPGSTSCARRAITPPPSRRWPRPATAARRSWSSRRPKSPASANCRLIGADQMRRAGLNVDLQEMDFGTVIRRRTNQGPPDKGGWNVFFTNDRPLDPEHQPLWQPGLAGRRQGGLGRLAGQPAHRGTAPAAWLDAADLDTQRRIGADLQKQVWQDVPFIPMGEYWQTTAYRKDLTGIIPGCFAAFWGVRRA